MSQDLLRLRSGQSERDVKRFLDMRMTKNHITLFCQDIAIENTFGCKTSYDWILRFCNPKKNLYDVKFMQYVKQKLAEYKLSERKDHVYSVMRQLKESETVAYCCNVTESEVRIATKEFGKAIEEQQIFRIDQNIANSYLTRFSLNSKIIVYEKEIDLERLKYRLEKRNGNLEELDQFDIMNESEFQKLIQAQIEESFRPEEDANSKHIVIIEDNTPYALDEDTVYNGRIDIPIRYTEDMCKNNDVYTLSEQYPDDKRSFEYTLYAPPNSGKTTLNKQYRSFLDTDWMYYWPYLNGSPAIITNMSHFVDKSARFVGVVPTFEKFKRRCKDIPNYEDMWYEDMLDNVLKGNIIILSNKVLNQIKPLHQLLNPG